MHCEIGLIYVLFFSVLQGKSFILSSAVCRQSAQMADLKDSSLCHLHTWLIACQFNFKEDKLVKLRFNSL